MRSAVALRPSVALDALRKAKQYGSLRDAVIVYLGMWLVMFSALVPFSQEVIMMSFGIPSMLYGFISLVVRSVRSHRSGHEL
jgi:hypothetical protein